MLRLTCRRGVAPGTVWRESVLVGREEDEEEDEEEEEEEDGKSVGRSDCGCIKYWSREEPIAFAEDTPVTASA